GRSRELRGGGGATDRPRLRAGRHLALAAVGCLSLLTVIALLRSLSPQVSAPGPGAHSADAGSEHLRIRRRHRGVRGSLTGILSVSTRSAAFGAPARDHGARSFSDPAAPRYAPLRAAPQL